MKSMLIQARGSLNSRLSEFEPLVLLLVPLVSLFLAQIIGSVFGVVHEKGLKACLIGFIMGLLKMIPGVQNYIDAEKQKVSFCLNLQIVPVMAIFLLLLVVMYIKSKHFKYRNARQAYLMLSSSMCTIFNCC
jgi:hypothetical protein